MCTAWIIIDDILTEHEAKCEAGPFKEESQPCLNVGMHSALDGMDVKCSSGTPTLIFDYLAFNIHS